MSDLAIFDMPISEILSGGQNLGMLGQSENSSKWVIIGAGSAPLSDKENDRGCTLSDGNQSCRQSISTIEICFAKYIYIEIYIYIMVSKCLQKVLIPGIHVSRECSTVPCSRGRGPLLSGSV